MGGNWGEIALLISWSGGWEGGTARYGVTELGELGCSYLEIDEEQSWKES